MAVAIGQFDQMLALVTQHAAELMQARVWVINEHQVVIASSERGALGMPLDWVRLDPAAGCIHAPVRWQNATAEIIVELSGGDVISPRLAQVLVELVISQTTNVADLPDRQQLKSQLIHTLLFGPIPDEASLLRQGQILGFDLTLPRAIILIDASSYILAHNLAHNPSPQPERDELLMQRRAGHVIATVVSFFHLPTDTICAYLGDGEVAVLKASSTSDLSAWTESEDGRERSSSSWANLTALKRACEALLARLRRETRCAVNIGIGRYHPGIRGLSHSYEDARAALELGRHFAGQNQIHCLDALGIAAFIGVADERTKVSLARHLLSPLDHEPDLIETLDAFFQENRSPGTTAHRLCVHRNTLGYRLDKIASLTGLDPRRFDDAVQIRLALLLRSLQNSPASCARAQ
jgi:carbohydrate diacid regulator